MPATLSEVKDTLITASRLVTRHGYSKHGSGDPNYSAAIAIEHAAQQLNTGDKAANAAMIGEAAQVSFAGWLYMTGLARRLTSISDFADMVSYWEDQATPPRSKDGPTTEVIASYLWQAAACITMAQPALDWETV